MSVVFQKIVIIRMKIPVCDVAPVGGTCEVMPSCVIVGGTLVLAVASNTKIKNTSIRSVIDRKGF